jgi:hypothetical protein
MPPETSNDNSKNHPKIIHNNRAINYIDILSKIVALITWPIFLIILLVLFYSPLNRIITVFTTKIEKSYEVSVGSLTFKLQQKALESGNLELAKIIKGLSDEEIKWILKIGNGSHRVIGSNDGGSGITSKYHLGNSIESWIILQNMNLLDSNINLIDYKKYFYSLQPVNNYISKNKLTQQEEQKLLKNSVHLSESGKQAYNIILSTVSEMIK